MRSSSQRFGWRLSLRTTNCRWKSTRPSREIDVASLETSFKYEGYLKRQEQAVERQRRQEGRQIPDDFCFVGIPGLSREIVERLTTVRPATIGQASRIPGVTPAAIAVIGAYLNRPRTHYSLIGFTRASARRSKPPRSPRREEQRCSSAIRLQRAYPRITSFWRAGTARSTSRRSRTWTKRLIGCCSSRLRRRALFHHQPHCSWTSGLAAARLRFRSSWRSRVSS